jgi:uracil-DNA glycosylase
MTDLRTQLLHRLDSLQAAGIDFLPKVSPVEFDIQPIAFTSEIVEETEPSEDRVLVSLTVLAEQVAKCNKCPELFSSRTQTVFGVGPMNPEVCFVGEAPGADEDRQGEPFVGAAGQLLDRIINACGFTRSEVYICNTLKCRPPNNRTPTDEERANCWPFFEEQLRLISPKLIVCLGGTAAKNVLKTTTGITRLRGQVYRYGEVPVICTYHPSYIIRQEGEANKKARGECWDDMKLMLQTLGKTPPPRT